jgi:hypothetical protein
MKSKILLLIITPLFAFSQLQEGDLLLETNYGFIGGKGLWATIADEAGIPVTSIGPLTLRSQYMTSDKFGLGLDINYSSRKIDGNTGSYQDNNGNNQNFTYDLKQDVIRLMIRTSWEFINNEKFQMNWANSIGYRSSTWTFNVTDNSSASENDLSYDFLSSPLAFRTAIGIRYFILENFGFNFEVVGLSGGAFMNGGLTLKL